MAKKRSSSRPPSTIGALLTVLVVAVALLISRLTGVDLLGTGGTPAPTTVVTGAPPTQATGTEVASAPGSVASISIPQGFGASKGFWRIYFTAPTGSSDASTYVGGIDTQLAADIAQTTRTLDIAAFEFNNEVLTQAILDAKQRGVVVRIVTDNEHGVEDTADTSLARFQEAGIPIVDDDRSALMHDKFMILDSTTVWTGSWNYTVNDTYRNNNHALALRSQRAVAAYQAEFDEMFTSNRFGPRSPQGNSVSFTQDGVPIQIYFPSEDKVASVIVNTLKGSRQSIKFMAFSFTLSDLSTAIRERASSGVTVQGIFESRGSETQFSQLTPLFCAGLDVRQDGNRFVLHHKVFIIDDETVIAGSYNFSSSASDDNDENMFIIKDRDLTAQYVAEFNRRWQEAVKPTDLTCS
jgi:phosphatidylserine/phosphatidylglycerophosphate/cardiolipin synthase-like enzyme